MQYNFEFQTKSGFYFKSIESLQNSTDSTDEVNEYLASRAAFFFQSIMNDFASMLQGTSKFISCEDFRFSAGACAIEKNNDDCKGNDICAKNPEEEYSKYLIIKKN